MQFEKCEQPEKQTEKINPLTFEGLNPQPTAEIRGQNIAKISEYKAQGRKVIGVEITDPGLADLLDVNIDPQHLGGRSDIAAIEEALTATLPEGRCVFVTFRPDMDSIGAMSVLRLRIQQEELTSEAVGRIMLIAKIDKASSGSWPGKIPLPSQAKLYEDDQMLMTGGLSQMVVDRLPLEEKVRTMERWILRGEEATGYREKWLDARKKMVEAIEKGEIHYEDNGGYSVVISKHPFVTSIGYALAPVVIALNPEFLFRDNQTGEARKIRKYTIAQYTEGYIDLTAVRRELEKHEKGWGGSYTIIGSPQGVDSKVDLRLVKMIVEKHLHQVAIGQGKEDETRANELVFEGGVVREVLKRVPEQGSKKVQYQAVELTYRLKKGEEIDLMKLLPFNWKLIKAEFNSEEEKRFVMYPGERIITYGDLTVPGSFVAFFHEIGHAHQYQNGEWRNPKEILESYTAEYQNRALAEEEIKKRGEKVEDYQKITVYDPYGKGTGGIENDDPWFSMFVPKDIIEQFGSLWAKEERDAWAYALKEFRRIKRVYGINLEPSLSAGGARPFFKTINQALSTYEHRFQEQYKGKAGKFSRKPVGDF